MGIKNKRKKPTILLLSIIYRLNKILPLSKKTRFKLYLDLAWIFNRLSHELSFELYTPKNHPVREYSANFILADINKSDTVLDLGCNMGDISFMIAEKAKEVIGIDYNKKAIKIAKQRYKRHNLKFYNEEALEFLKSNQKKFDILILSHFIEHLDNPKEFLLNCKDYFKKIYIELPDFDKSYLNHYRKDFNLKLVYTDSDHVYEFDRDDIRALLQELNIRIIKEEYKYGIQKLWCKNLV